MDRYKAVVERVATSHALAMVLGGIDSGKSTLGKIVAATAVNGGRRVGYIDTDLGQKSVGPPATVTLKMLSRLEDVRGERFASPDAVHFVGSTSPQGNALPLVIGAKRMVERARADGADLVLVDTSGYVSGVYGQILKFHKVELLQPDVVVGLQRGEELAPLLGVIQRFFPCEVISLDVPPEVQPRSVDERAQARERAFRSYFDVPLQRWRVKPTVFMPALPALFDESALDRLLVGVSLGGDGYAGLGYLEWSAEERLLRMLSPVGEAPKALKLGSIRLDADFRPRKVDLRNLFGSD